MVNYADQLSNVQLSNYQRTLVFLGKITFVCYILLDSTSLKTFENFSICVHEKYSSVVF